MYPTVDIREFPLSVRLVFSYLKNEKISDVAHIMESTGLSRRSVMYAVKVLRDANLIDIQICLSDTRRRYYCIKISGEH
ncbi:MarR family transcriptional regulator [Thermoplasma acidophilum]|uniref:MarR family transcriptional regulator n=1 Tax=Thermoplasma acidophilum TaxID=2303 RepID=UPI00001660E7|nr:helix-turn-helix domain-containing protein [Thermoplasma acidophilum]MCY0851119.1 helix-turn-helix domain-containing protein [Thermoplasma acidophilum]